MARHIALLRGINLGSRQRVHMPALRDLLAGHGHANVTTYVQSGNVVLDSHLQAATLERRLRRQIADGLGVDVPVIVRTRDELAEVIERDPLGEIAADPKRYSVSFLSAEPDPEVVRALAQADVAPERFVVSGREIYVWQPDGVQRSRLGRVLSEQRLGVTATARNWNTVCKLLQLADRAA